MHAMMFLLSLSESQSELNIKFQRKIFYLYDLENDLQGQIQGWHPPSFDSWYYGLYLCQKS